MAEIPPSHFPQPTLSPEVISRFESPHLLRLSGSNFTQHVHLSGRNTLVLFLNNNAKKTGVNTIICHECEQIRVPAFQRLADAWNSDHVNNKFNFYDITDNSENLNSTNVLTSFTGHGVQVAEVDCDIALGFKETSICSTYGLSVYAKGALPRLMVFSKDINDFKGKNVTEEIMELSNEEKLIIKKEKELSVDGREKGYDTLLKDYDIDNNPWGDQHPTISYLGLKKYIEKYLAYTCSIENTRKCNKKQKQYIKKFEEIMLAESDKTGKKSKSKSTKNHSVNGNATNSISQNNSNDSNDSTLNKEIHRLTALLSDGLKEAYILYQQRVKAMEAGGGGGGSPPEPPQPGFKMSKDKRDWAMERLRFLKELKEREKLEREREDKYNDEKTKGEL